MKAKLVPIKNCVEKARTWNPVNEAKDEIITYIDIAAVDKDLKKIVEPTLCLGSEAPSRARQLVQKNDVLVSTVRPNLNSVAVVSEKFSGATASTGYTILRPLPEILDTQYLFHWVKTDHFINEMVKLATGQSYPAVSDKIILNSQIPLPSIEEQHRVASILDKADELRQKRQQAIEKLDQLLKATFIDMFGDPVSNPKGWDLVKVGGVVDEFIGGKNIECPDESESKYKILKVSAVTSKVYKPNESKFAPNNFEPNPLAIVQQGDLLFSRANTTELVAATAYVWDTPENIVLPDKLWKFSISDDSKVNKLYLWDLFKNTEFRNELSKLSSGTSGSMKNISKGKLNEMLMPLPPKEQQDKFAEISTKIWEQIKTFRQSSASLNSLFKTLQNQAFSGNL